MGEGDFKLKESLAVNFGVNMVSAGVGNKIKHAANTAKLATKVATNFAGQYTQAKYVEGLSTDEALVSATVGTVAGEAFERSARAGYRGLKSRFGEQIDSANQYLSNAFNAAKEKIAAKITRESSSGPKVEFNPAKTNKEAVLANSSSVHETTSPDFYVGPAGPEATLPGTGYRYMDSTSKYAQQTIDTKEAPLSYFGFSNFSSGSEARDAFQIFYERGNPASWGDGRLKGQFDTLQLFDNKGVPKVRVPFEAGDTGSKLEPITNYYPRYGSGGQPQLVPIDKMTVKFDEVQVIPE